MSRTVSTSSPMICFSILHYCACRLTCKPFLSSLFRHKTTNARDCCSNAKFMMLHVRDCPGTTPSFDICPFPWCRKTKHLLYHLVSCECPDTCKICTPTGISGNLRTLQGLNNFRAEKRKEQFAAAALSSPSNAANKSVHNKPGVGGAQLASNAAAAKKNVQQRRVSRTGFIPSAQPRVNRGAKFNHGNQNKHPALIASQNGIAKRNGLSVPSPIPNTGLSKPTNPLAASQVQGDAGRPQQRQAPVAKPNFALTSTITKSIVSTVSKCAKPTQSAPAHTSLHGPANPLTALHPTTTYGAPKTSSPPNPLKGLPIEQSTTHNTSFPNLPNQISVMDNDGNSPAKDRHSVLRSNPVKIKVEGDQ